MHKFCGCVTFQNIHEVSVRALIKVFGSDVPVGHYIVSQVARIATLWPWDVLALFILHGVIERSENRKEGVIQGHRATSDLYSNH